MNQKKKTGKNTGTIKGVVVSFLILIIMTVLTVVVSYYMDRSIAEIMRLGVSIFMGNLILLFLWVQSVQTHTLAFDNEAHQIRFFILYFVCCLISLGMILFPVVTWVFLPIMVTLSIFSNPFIGLVSGSILLLLTVSLSPEATIYIFFLYFLLGIIGISLFRKLDEDFRVSEPLFLSSLSSITLQTAYLVIFQNENLSLEILLFPVLNLFTNLVILFLILRYFVKQGVYSLMDRYAQINDPEFPLLAQLKQENKELYFDAVHRAYLGDRISKRLQINDSAVKGCSYYYKLAAQSGMQSEDFSLPDCFRSFPDELNTLIEECIKGEYGSKEACVVLTCDLIISRIRQAQADNQNRDVPYEKLIKGIFDTMMEDGRLLNCEISLKDLRIMESVCIEEKLYYDFLR